MGDRSGCPWESVVLVASLHGAASSDKAKLFVAFEFSPSFVFLCSRDKEKRNEAKKKKTRATGVLAIVPCSDGTSRRRKWGLIRIDVWRIICKSRICDRMIDSYSLRRVLMHRMYLATAKFRFIPDYAVESASDASILDVQGCRREAQAHPEGALSIRFDRPCRR